MKVPIIATNGSAIPEIITDGKDGLLFKPKSAEDLSNKILFLLSNKRISLELAENAYKKANILFDMNRNISKIEQTYDNAYNRVIKNEKD